MKAWLAFQSRLLIIQSACLALAAMERVHCLTSLARVHVNVGELLTSSPRHEFCSINHICVVLELPIIDLKHDASSRRSLEICRVQHHALGAWLRRVQHNDVHFQGSACLQRQVVMFLLHFMLLHITKVPFLPSHRLPLEVGNSTHNEPMQGMTQCVRHSMRQQCDNGGT